MASDVDPRRGEGGRGTGVVRRTQGDPYIGREGMEKLDDVLGGRMNVAMVVAMVGRWQARWQQRGAKSYATHGHGASVRRRVIGRRE